jgi:hypothetical protein
MVVLAIMSTTRLLHRIRIILQITAVRWITARTPHRALWLHSSLMPA